MSVERTSVLIVGAGPTGMVLALFLSRQGIKSRIIDKNAGPGEQSRAIAVQARTLEFYRQIGLADSVVQSGLKVEHIAMRASGKVVAQAEFSGIGRELSFFAYALAYPQDEHEKLLVAQLEQEGIVIERHTELVSFTQQNDKVVATLKSPQGESQIEADYLCGCDGAHSAVRQGLKLDFPGGTYSQMFYVADVDPATPIAVGLEVAFGSKDFCIVLPIRQSGSVRLIGIVPPEHEQEAQIDFDDVRDSVLHNTEIKVGKVNWFSTYHVHHRVVEHFRRDRVFLAGDAAHIHSPAGGQGMNTGIGDAVNLAWKLAAVIQKRAAPSLLDSYEAERLPFAQWLVKTTDKMFQAIASRTRFGAFWRTHVMPHLLPLILSMDFSRRWMFRLISQTRIAYHSSPLSRGEKGPVQPGDRLPWVAYPDRDNYQPLQSLDWQVHVYGEASKQLEAACLRNKISLHVFALSDRARRGGLEQEKFYLLRPDGYIGLIAPQQESGQLESYLSAFQIKPRAQAS